MAIQVMAAASTSAHYHVAVAYSNPNANVTVSTGLTPQRVLCIPIHSDNVRFTFNGTFGSGSASTQVIIEVAGDATAARAGAFVPILTVSAPQTTILPIQTDHILRLRHQWTSAAVAVTNASVDAWVG